MKRLFLLLLLPAVLAAAFGIQLVVQSAAVRFDLYEQEGAAVLGGSPVQFGAPVEYSGNATQPVNYTIPSFFLNGSNFTVVEDGLPVATVRNGPVLSWNATLSSNATISFFVPAPTLSSVDEDATAYRHDFIVAAQTPLENSSYSLAVPSGFTDFALYENLSGAAVDRTATYSLSLSGGNATFMNIFFTNATFQRALWIEAQPASSPSRGGGSGSAPEQRVIFEDLEFRLPAAIEGQIGSETVAYGRVLNPDTQSQRIRLSVSPEDEAISLDTRSLQLEGTSSYLFGILYRPLAGAEELAVEFVVTAPAKTYRVPLRFIPLPAPQVVRVPAMSVTVVPQERELAITASSEEGEVEAVLRDEYGRVVYRSDRQERLLLNVDVQALQAGTYEVCVIMVEEGARYERCSPVALRAQPGLEEPIQLDYEPPESWAPLALGIVLFMLIVIFGFCYVLLRNRPRRRRR